MDSLVFIVDVVVAVFIFVVFVWIVDRTLTKKFWDTSFSPGNLILNPFFLFFGILLAIRGMAGYVSDFQPVRYIGGEKTGDKICVAHDYLARAVVVFAHDIENAENMADKHCFAETCRAMKCFEVENPNEDEYETVPRLESVNSSQGESTQTRTLGEGSI